MASEEPVFANVSIGQEVYNEDGERLGSIRGVDDDGFYVASPSGTDTLTLTDARDVFGTAYVMWRCWECGEMGEIGDQLPANCPSCDAPREELYYWAED
ncbi:rubredoxin-like domain-containing protein [Halorubrum sp. SP9]|uniref:DUF7130 family rubredoxin-like protein n=1 Tax=Halorubrum sp. SP9 TaxID=1537267 RepID=UPI0010F9A749|nr:hypothetical protein [Halorubrum sp. SP9]TKX69118.1 hypothetical protein EXE45_09475 [Halorubrum sp. SP9]